MNSATITQQDFLKVKELKPLPDQKRRALQRAIEDLTSARDGVRRQAVDRLVKLDAHRRSPLAVSALAQHLRDPDIEVRVRVAEALLACVMALKGKWRPAPQVCVHLQRALGELGEEQIIALLELVDKGHLPCSDVCWLLRYCAASGEHLCHILVSRQFEISLRLIAAEIIGANGLLEAIPTLETLERRLLHYADGQLAMGFAPRAAKEAELLLPALRSALKELAEASI